LFSGNHESRQRKEPAHIFETIPFFFPGKEMVRCFLFAGKISNQKTHGCNPVSLNSGSQSHFGDKEISISGFQSDPLHIRVA
jgi:hypothetical protein